MKHGAAIFATTFSDGSLAIEKCDPYREGYNECFSYLAGEGEEGRLAGWEPRKAGKSWQPFDFAQWHQAGPAWRTPSFLRWHRLAARTFLGH